MQLMSDAENRPMTGELPADDLIEIHDPEIDPAEIMAAIPGSAAS